MKALLIDYTRYNSWANRSLICVFENQADSLLEQHITSSFASVRQTMLHIWDAQAIWLDRLQGYSPLSFPSKDFSGSMADIFSGLEESSDALHDFLMPQEQEFFLQTMTYTTLKSGEFSRKVADMVLHCVNHSTYHRGQLITMARQLGIDGHIDPLDFIWYKRHD
jgi:uncharacterized damage-inducible protein DinB